jgi:hypothetical protein
VVKRVRVDEIEKRRFELEKVEVVILRLRESQRRFESGVVRELRKDSRRREREEGKDRVKPLG